MKIVPAKVAGVERIIMTTPANSQGKVNPAVLVAANEAGADEVYKAGGAQAIGALAYGTASIPRVDKIVGPGNIYVALAKRAVYGHVSIDSIAGPSEILVLADETANPRYVAADLLSQAEHDELASAILVTTSEDLAERVNHEIDNFLRVLSRREIIEKYTITAGYDGFVRAAGFFSEPAVAAQYISISLLVVLFQESEQTNIKTAIFYSIVMLLTFSANAYVALMVCWVLWGVYSNKENKRNLVKILLLVILFIVGIFFVVNNGATSSVLNRLVELKNGGRTSGSSVVRVLRGITFYNHMPLLYQLLGSGFGNFIQFKEMYNITTIYEVADEYMNTNAYVLVSSGVIGFILYVGTLFRRTMGRTLVSKMIVIIVLVFGLSSSIYSSGQFIIMLLFIMYAPKKGEIL